MRGRRRLGRAAGAILLAGGVGGCAGAAGGPGTATPVPEAATVEPAGPVSWSFHTLAGQPLSLEDLRGGPVLVNLWATWCPPCIRELPSIAALASALPPDAGVAFLLVSPEEPERVRAFLDRHLRGAPAGILAATEATLAPAELGELVLPTTLILDHEGRVALRHDGAADWDRPEVRALLLGLAAAAQEGRAR